MIAADSYHHQSPREGWVLYTVLVGPVLHPSEGMSPNIHPKPTEACLRQQAVSYEHDYATGVDEEHVKTAIFTLPTS